MVGALLLAGDVIETCIGAFANGVTKDVLYFLVEIPTLVVPHRIDIQAVQLALRLYNHLVAGARHARLTNLMEGGETPRLD